MKCLECRYVNIIEYGCKGFIGETIIRCDMCNEVYGEMEDCEDFEDKIIDDEYADEDTLPCGCCACGCSCNDNENNQDIVCRP